MSREGASTQGAIDRYFTGRSKACVARYFRERAGVEDVSAVTVEQIALVRASDWLKTKGLGRGTLEDIWRRLRQAGHHPPGFGPDETDFFRAAVRRSVHLGRARLLELVMEEFAMMKIGGGA